MGLDSVELLMGVENYFGISISDSEAEKIYTIQAMVDTVARHLGINETDNELRDRIFKRVSQALLDLGFADTSLSLTDHISKYLSSGNKANWAAFRNELQLDVPKPDTLTKESKKITDKIRLAVNWKPMYDWTSITVEQFVTAICANNLEELVDKQHIRGTYEIYIAVTAITVDKIGVEYYEIAPEKSFTWDLGVD